MMAREIIAEATARAGTKRLRVLSLIDRLHRDRMISFDQYAAAGILRNTILLTEPPSEGVSSYGGNIGHADGASKADRVGQRLTGFRIDHGGHVYWRGARQWTEHQQRLEEAIFAAVGVRDDAGVRRVQMLHAALLIEAVLETENMPSLAGIARRLTDVYGGASKKIPAFALGAICIWLTRLAQHFRLSK